MTLRVPADYRQLIFAIIALLALGMQASAQHSIKLKGSPAPVPGVILGADGRNVQFRTAAGTVGYPLAAIESVVMPDPPELAPARVALAAGDPAKALAAWQIVFQKYKGLPVDWAKLAASTTANLLVSAEEFDKAEAAFKEFEQLYPGAGGLLTKVGLARIAVAKKDYAAAKGALEPVAEAALKEKNVSRENAFAYSQAFFALGLVNEAEGKLQDALENYLRTVTIFFHDPSARAGAQKHADDLRAQNKDKLASEQIAVP